MKSFPISVQRWWKRRIRARQDTRRKHELILTAQPTTSNSNRYENRNTFISQVDATPQPATPTTLVTAHKSDLPAQQTNPEPYSPVPQIDPVRWAEKYQDIHDELNERFDRGEIFPDSEVQSFWRKHKHFYAGQRWYIHFCASVNYITPYLKILMILTLCKYSDWDSLPRVFNENMQRSDEYLPFNKEALNQPHFLRAHAVPFYKFQWAFCPLVITRFHEEIHLGQGFCSPLPFTQASEKIGEGATASVTKEVIAAGHLKYSDGTLVTFTRKPYAVACKNIMAKDVLYEEIQNLKKLRRSLSKHDHILVNFAILVEDHPVHTKWYRILYDLADFDLNYFLSKSPADSRTTRRGCSPFGRNNSHLYGSMDLIDQCKSIADALDFLHNGLYDSAMLSRSHNDLTPENILVFVPDEPTPTHRYPVGKWKITDFGISRIKPKRDSPKAGSSVLSYERLNEDLQGQPDSLRRPMSRTPSPVSAHSGSPRRATHMSHPDQHDRALYLDSGTALSVQTQIPGRKTSPKRGKGTFTAPELDRLGAQGQNPIHARRADIWSLGCILIEVVTFAVDPALIEELRQVARGDDTEGPSFHSRSPSNYGEIKPSIVKWLNLLPTRCEAPRQQWVVECKDLILAILTKDPGKRPLASDIREELEAIRSRQRLRESKSTQETSFRVSFVPPPQNHHPPSPPSSPPVSEFSTSSLQRQMSNSSASRRSVSGLAGIPATVSELKAS